MCEADHRVAAKEARGAFDGVRGAKGGVEVFSVFG